MLTLPIKKKWFDMILMGKKNVEYREPTGYWIHRLRRACVVQQVPMNGCGLRLQLRNGYGLDVPTMFITLSKIDIGPGIEEWGAEPGKKYLRLHIAMRSM